MTYLNMAAMLATIAFGAIGWLKPQYVMRQLELTTDGSTLGLSEIRAANGALFIGIGLAALIFNQPLGYLMVGCAYAGAAVGRLTGILVDNAGNRTSWSFLAVECTLALSLILINS